MKLQDLKSFEDACKVEGLDANTVIPDMSVFPEKDRQSLEAYAKLVIVARAANKIANDGNEWAPNWDDEDEYKYQSWFWMGGSSGFRFGVCDLWFSYSGVGSRLCFISYDVADYIGKQFEDLFKQFMIIK